MCVWFHTALTTNFWIIAGEGYHKKGRQERLVGVFRRFHLILTTPQVALLISTGDDMGLREGWVTCPESHTAISSSRDRAPNPIWPMQSWAFPAPARPSPQVFQKADRLWDHERLSKTACAKSLAPRWSFLCAFNLFFLEVPSEELEVYLAI